MKSHFLDTMPDWQLRAFINWNEHGAFPDETENASRGQLLEYLEDWSAETLVDCLERFDGSPYNREPDYVN